MDPVDIRFNDIPEDVRRWFIGVTRGDTPLLLAEPDPTNKPLYVIAFPFVAALAALVVGMPLWLLLDVVPCPTNLEELVTKAVFAVIFGGFAVLATLRAVLEFVELPYRPGYYLLPGTLVVAKRATFTLVHFSELPIEMDRVQVKSRRSGAVVEMRTLLRVPVGDGSVATFEFTYDHDGSKGGMARDRALASFAHLRAALAAGDPYAAQGNRFFNVRREHVPPVTGAIAGPRTRLFPFEGKRLFVLGYAVATAATVLGCVAGGYVNWRRSADEGERAANTRAPAAPERPKFADATLAAFKAKHPKSEGLAFIEGMLRIAESSTDGSPFGVSVRVTWPSDKSLEEALAGTAKNPALLRSPVSTVMPELREHLRRELDQKLREPIRATTGSYNLDGMYLNAFNERPAGPSVDLQVEVLPTERTATFGYESGPRAIVGFRFTLRFKSADDKVLVTRVLTPEPMASSPRVTTPASGERYVFRAMFEGTKTGLREAVDDVLFGPK